jgi:hypothetical protein
MHRAMSVNYRFVVCLLDQIASSGISLLYGKMCLHSRLSPVGQRRTVHVFYPLLKFFFRWIGAVNRRSRLLPPRLSDCSQVNGIESDSINKLSDDLFRLGIVTGDRKSNTISTSGRAPRLRQGIRYNRVKGLDNRLPNLLLNPRAIREAII